MEGTWFLICVTRCKDTKCKQSALILLVLQGSHLFSLHRNVESFISCSVLFIGIILMQREFYDTWNRSALSYFTKVKIALCTYVLSTF